MTLLSHSELRRARLERQVVVGCGGCESATSVPDDKLELAMVALLLGAAAMGLTYESSCSGMLRVCHDHENSTSDPAGQRSGHCKLP
eukprot:5846020-Prymnesium_polylepis.1